MFFFYVSLLSVYNLAYKFGIYSMVYYLAMSKRSEIMAKRNTIMGSVDIF